MPATLRKLAAPAASAFRPTGPAAIETLPPKVSEPACANVLTALASLRMKTKSVSSKPICPPKPPPIVPMAEGADHEPSASLATTMPEPKRAVPRKPALKTVRMARPCVSNHQYTYCSVSRHGRQLGTTKHTSLAVSGPLHVGCLRRHSPLHWQGPRAE